MTHWSYPNEPTTRFNQVYTACMIYVNLNEIRYHELEITCPKCKQLMISFEEEL